jgi:hypothetical protein
MNNRTVYLVKATALSGNYIWVGGEQSRNLGRARYWRSETEAQGVADSNQKRMDTELVNVYGATRKKDIQFTLVPISLKDVMIARLKG